MIFGNSVINIEYTDWKFLIDKEGFRVEFYDPLRPGDELTAISNSGDKLEFFVAGACDRTLCVKIPISLCRDEFYKLSSSMETETYRKKYNN